MEDVLKFLHCEGQAISDPLAVTDNVVTTVTSVVQPLGRYSCWEDTLSLTKHGS